MNDANVHYEKKCPICGKVFVPAPYHAWKASNIGTHPLVCSYHCALESDRRRDEKQKAAKTRAYIKRDKKGVKEK